jgi:hypothetical protein
VISHQDPAVEFAPEWDNVGTKRTICLGFTDVNQTIYTNQYTLLGTLIIIA